MERDREHSVDRERARGEVSGQQCPKRARQAAHTPIFERMHGLAQGTLEDEGDLHIGQAWGQPAQLFRVGHERGTAVLAEERAEARATRAALGEEQREQRVEQGPARHGDLDCCPMTIGSIVVHAVRWNGPAVLSTRTGGTVME